MANDPNNQNDAKVVSSNPTKEQSWEFTFKQLDEAMKKDPSKLSDWFETFSCSLLAVAEKANLEQFKAKMATDKNCNLNDLVKHLEENNRINESQFLAKLIGYMEQQIKASNNPLWAAELAANIGPKLMASIECSVLPNAEHVVDVTDPEIAQLNRQFKNPSSNSDQTQDREQQEIADLNKQFQEQFSGEEKPTASNADDVYEKMPGASEEEINALVEQYSTLFSSTFKDLVEFQIQTIQEEAKVELTQEAQQEVGVYEKIIEKNKDIQKLNKLMKQFIEKLPEFSQEEGVFRVPGQKTTVDEAFQKFSTQDDVDIDTLSNLSPHDAAGLLKNAIDAVEFDKVSDKAKKIFKDFEDIINKNDQNSPEISKCLPEFIGTLKAENENELAEFFQGMLTIGKELAKNAQVNKLNPSAISTSFGGITIERVMSKALGEEELSPADMANMSPDEIKSKMSMPIKYNAVYAKAIDPNVTYTQSMRRAPVVPEEMSRKKSTSFLESLKDVKKQMPSISFGSITSRLSAAKEKIGQYISNTGIGKKFSDYFKNKQESLYQVKEAYKKFNEGNASNEVKNYPVFQTNDYALKELTDVVDKERGKYVEVDYYISQVVDPMVHKYQQISAKNLFDIVSNQIEELKKPGSQMSDLHKMQQLKFLISALYRYEALEPEDNIKEMEDLKKDVWEQFISLAKTQVQSLNDLTDQGDLEQVLQFNSMISDLNAYKEFVPRNHISEFNQLTENAANIFIDLAGKQVQSLRDAEEKGSDYPQKVADLKGILNKFKSFATEENKTKVGHFINGLEKFVRSSKPPITPSYQERVTIGEETQRAETDAKKGDDQKVAPKNRKLSNS